MQILPLRSRVKDYQMLDKHGKMMVDTVCSLEKKRIFESTKEAVGNSGAKIMELRQIKQSERYIPRYTTPSAAGFNVPLDGAEFEMILVNDSVPSDADYAVNIQGESMLPYIHDGDMVYVKKDAEITTGDVGIFCVDGAMYCKQYYLRDDGTVILASANPKLRQTNIIISPDSASSVRACGKVLLPHKIALPDYILRKTRQ